MLPPWLYVPLCLLFAEIFHQVINISRWVIYPLMLILGTLMTVGAIYQG